MDLCFRTSFSMLKGLLMSDEHTTSVKIVTGGGIVMWICKLFWDLDDFF